MLPHIKEVMDKYNTFQVFQLSQDMLPELIDTFQCKKGIVQYKGNEIIDSYIKNYNNQYNLNLTLQDLIVENETTSVMTYASHGRNLKVMNIFIEKSGIQKPIILGDKKNTMPDYEYYIIVLQSVVLDELIKLDNESIPDIKTIKSSLDLYALIFDFYCSNFKIVKTNDSLCKSRFGDKINEYNDIRGKNAVIVRRFFLSLCLNPYGNLPEKEKMYNDYIATMDLK